MSFEVRPCASVEELGRGLRAIFHFFGRVPDEETSERFSRVLPPERMHAAYDGEDVVGGAGAFPMRLTVPGGRVPAAGVTVVAVLPTHRRQGVLRSLMRAQLDDVHARGEPVAYLWASEETIYGRFGYGVASLAGSIELPRVRAGYALPLERQGRGRLVDVGEALELFPNVYERVAVETPGMFVRTRDWWESRVLADPEWRRGDGGEMARVLLEVDGRPDGYALYRLHPKFEQGVSVGYTNVIEALGASPQATAEIWRFLLDVDWVDRVKAFLLPVDHPLLFLLAEPRRLGLRVGDGLWVRLVDVGAALSARAYGEGAPIVLEVEDAFCPWNAGRWRLEPGGAERTRDEPGLRLDVSSLASVYLGGFTLAELARAGRVLELRDGALAAADALLGTDRAPWCPEIF